MILTVVGSGTLVPSPLRSTPALALEEGGFQVTVDGGTGTLRRQSELGIDFRRTATLFFTHIHPDHTLDLLHFLFACRYTPRFRRTEPVRIVGPPGFATFLERFRDPVTPWTDGGEGGLEVLEMTDRMEIEEGPLRVRAIQLSHSVVDLGYRFTTAQGGSMAFTGDTRMCEAAVELARGVDILVSECSGDSRHPAPGHLTAPEVGQLAAEAEVGQVVLTHLYPLANDRVRVEEVARQYPGPVLLATDGTRFLV